MKPMGRQDWQRAFGPASAVLPASVAVVPLSSRAARAGASRRAARWLVAAALAVGTSAGASTVRAQDESAEAPAAPKTDVGEKLDAAKTEIEQLDYPAARDTLLVAIGSGTATSEELAQAYFALGSVEAALGNDVESTDSFYLALMIQPSLLFPEGGSPKIRERLNAARSRVTEVGVLQARASVRGGVLEVHLDNDPLDLVKRVDVMMTREGGESGKVTLKKKAMAVEVEPGVQTIQVGLYDETGNQLKLLEVDPKGADGAGGGDSPVGTPPSIWASWGLWAGVAGALAAGGTYFIMEAGNIDADVQDARDAPNPNPAEVERLEENRDRVALYGVIGLSMAGAAAVTSGALLVFGGKDKADAPGEAATEATLSPNIAPGHYGARFTLKF
jgi:hypothetical protein